MYKGKGKKAASPKKKTITNTFEESERVAFAESPKKFTKQQLSKQKPVNYFSNVFPGDDDPKTFDKLDRI